MADGGSYTKIDGEWVPTQQAETLKSKEVKSDESKKKASAGRD